MYKIVNIMEVIKIEIVDLEVIDRDGNEYISINECANMMGLVRQTVHFHLKKNDIRVGFVGKILCVNKDDITELNNRLLENIRVSKYRGELSEANDAESQ